LLYREARALVEGKGNRPGRVCEGQ
jgi:hypothetical protein